MEDDKIAIVKLCDMLDLAHALEKESDEEQFLKSVKKLLKDFEDLKQEHNDDKPQKVLLAFKVLEVSVSALRNIIDKVNTSEKFSLDCFRKHLEINIFKEEKLNWKAMETFCENIFHVNVSLKTLNLPLSIPKKVTKVQKIKPNRDSSQSQLTQPIRITEENRDKRDNYLASHVFNILKAEYKKNGKKEVSYLDFIIDPSSFSNTVLNIFTMSLIVKDNLVQMSLDENNKLLLKPVGQKQRSNQEQSEKNHLIITITYDKWKNLAKGLNIKEAIIPHT